MSCFCLATLTEIAFSTCLTAGEPQRLPGTLFLSQFDSLSTADVAAGSAEMKPEGVSLVPGRWGHGVRIRPGSHLAISPKGNLAPRQGTREGMTRPGQWYLDRVAGKLVYWPLPGEDPAKIKVIAPRLERILSVAGNSKQRMDWARLCTLEKLEICCIGGQGIQSGQLTDCRIADCHVHHTGACGIRTAGRSVLVARNHIHDVGVYYPSAVAVSAYSSAGKREKGLHLCRNEIHDGPYSGIIGGGRNNLIEENLIYRVMREMHDGAAIYGGMRNSVLRGNMVRDVVEVGRGYGASAYYLDEGARDCLVERNVAVGVPRPSHNHIAHNITIRDNVFAELAYDDRCLDVAVNVVTFDVAKVRRGATWGRDDGAEIAIAGKTGDGQAATFVLHGYAGGKIESVTDAGAPAGAAERLGEAGTLQLK